MHASFSLSFNEFYQSVCEVCGCTLCLVLIRSCSVFLWTTGDQLVKNNGLPDKAEIALYLAFSLCSNRVISNQRHHPLHYLPLLYSKIALLHSVCSTLEFSDWKHRLCSLLQFINLKPSFSWASRLVFDRLWVAPFSSTRWPIVRSTKWHFLCVAASTTHRAATMWSLKTLCLYVTPQCTDTLELLKILHITGHSLLTSSVRHAGLYGRSALVISLHT